MMEEVIVYEIPIAFIVLASSASPRVLFPVVSHYEFQQLYFLWVRLEQKGMFDLR